MKSSILPQHIAIIMDGNGRWAKQHGVKRSEGHRAGAEKLRAICGDVVDLGIPILSVYAFSTENWKRSTAEINALMAIFSDFFERYSDQLEENKIKVHFVGDLQGFSRKTQRICRKIEAKEIPEVRLDLYICFNYGGRNEILRAVKSLVASESREFILKNLDEELLRQHFYIPSLKDPDLIIRTAGEMRLSNFWLWQSAYAEFYSTNVFWPDFTRDELIMALNAYGKRERRYGGRLNE